MKMSSKNEGMERGNQSLKAPSATGDEIKLPKLSIGLPFPQLPRRMIVAIDGWAQTGKNTTGELVADSIGGVLVDSGRFYRGITKACMEAGVNLRSKEEIAKFCRGVTLDVCFGIEGGKVAEAQVSVNGRKFSKEDLRNFGSQTTKVASVFKVRELVNSTLRLCDCYGRVVMLGRDIGGVVFPNTPFKFFLDAPEYIREERHIKTTNSEGAIERDLEDKSRVIFADNALMIDTGKLVPEEVRGIILVEVFWRAFEGKINEEGI